MKANKSLQPQTTLVVDWSHKFDLPPASMFEQYDTSEFPIKHWNGTKWIEVSYESVQHIEAFGGDIVWNKELSK